VSVYILPALDAARHASSVSPLPAELVVSRLDSELGRDTCSLCWVGPSPLAGTVRKLWEPDASARLICSRCLVTLEMLAVQFGPDVCLQMAAAA
jgi:hypothetical protein